MLIYTAGLGLAVWFISDSYQTHTLKTVFNERLAERFSLQAQEHRTLFDRYVKLHNQVAKLLVQTNSIYHYVLDKKWSAKDKHKIIYHQEAPSWLPNLFAVRKIALPRYIFLLDTQNQPRELFYWNGILPPEVILNPDPLLIQLSENQSYLTMINDNPYLYTSEPIMARGKKIGTLVMSSPIDSEFMLESQTLATSKYTVALLAEDEATILVSSDPQLVPNGVKVSELEGVYQAIGKGFFDYGSSELVIRCVSFVPLSEVEELTQAVLNKERETRFLASILYVSLVMAIIFSLTRRILNLTQRVVEFSKTMAIRQPDMKTKDELAILEDRFILLSNAIKNETEALEYQAAHDPLTDLPNRKMLNERLQATLLRSSASNAPLVLIISDLNHFKEINDTLGHPIGDLVLQQAAERLHNTVRKTDMVARLGGDEFSILLPDTTLQQAERIAAEITDIFSIPFVAEGHKLNVGISIGMVEAPLHGSDVNILVQRADVAMYDAKRGNKSYVIYDPTEDTHHVSKLELMSELGQAINNKAIEIYYQAKLDINSDKIIGAEALTRWKHPERGNIPPDEFIPLAEQTGLILPLTKFVIEESLRQCGIWRRNNIDLGVSINISVQSLHDVDFTNTLRNNLEENNVPPDCCTIELTESDIMVDPIRAKAILLELASIGCVISIDDFGTGYSSLSYLKQLPVSEIKIDRSFVMEMAKDHNDKIIVKTIIDLAHNLEMNVVAEGVESQIVLNELKSLGCKIAQGFYIHKPSSCDKFIDFINQDSVKLNKITPTSSTKDKLNHTQ